MDSELWPGSMSSEEQSRAQAAELLPEEGRVRPKNGHFYKASRCQCPYPKTTKWNCCLTEWKKVSLPGLDPWTLTYLEFHIYSLVTIRQTETEQRDRERERRRVHTWSCVVTCEREQVCGDQKMILGSMPPQASLVLLSFFLLEFNFMCVFCLNVCVCITCVPGACGGQKGCQTL